MEQPREKSTGGNVLANPIWVTVIRGFQVFIALIVLGLCGRTMHDAYLSEEGFSLAIALFTWVGVAYILLSEKVSSLHKAYNVIAVIVVDGVLMILWLAAFAATASKRAKYVVPVDVDDCTDDDSVLNSKTCTIVKRDVILFKSGLAMMSAIAGLGALLWLLFVATFVWTLVMLLRGRKEGRFAYTSANNGNNYQMEPKINEAQSMPPQHTQQSQFNGAAPPQYPAQNYAPGDPYQQQQTQPAVSPYQNQDPYSAPQQQQQYQQPIQPQMTGQSQHIPPNQNYGGEYGVPSHTVSPPPQQYQQY
ncbi:hypothetical protein G7046_g9147 [Stylonectria norvegica]|nr:hypothetical protein G7046_g9147 [Stylonectria norvegica]